VVELVVALLLLPVELQLVQHMLWFVERSLVPWLVVALLLLPVEQQLAQHMLWFVERSLVLE
jgi:hypothetical protein